MFKLYSVPEINGKPLKPFSEKHQNRAYFAQNGETQLEIRGDDCQNFWSSIFGHFEPNKAQINNQTPGIKDVLLQSVKKLQRFWRSAKR